jgi:tetratricopeptide (TPR) repeat protein
VRVAELATIEYGDAPPSMKAAMGDLASGNFEEALAKLNSAEQYVEDQRRDRRPVPRAWFATWVLYYRGLCLREVGREKPERLDDAIRFLGKLIETAKEHRFVPDAYALLLECYGDKGDAAKFEDFVKTIQQAPPETRGGLLKRAQKVQADNALGAGEFDKARAIYETLSREPDKELAADATEGVIRCLLKANKTDQLQTYCKQVLGTGGTDTALQLVASNALADSLTARNMHREAAKQWVDSVVRYHPGRGSRLIREHERALYMLAKAYEALAGSAKDEQGKSHYTLVAGRTYRELALEYRGGRYEAEAAAKAAEMDK